MLMDKELDDVHHEQVDFPLFHINYDVFVSRSMEAMVKHVGSLYPGLELKVESNVVGYACRVHHSEYGTGLFILISTEEFPHRPPVSSTIVHECVHLSWDIMEGVGIDVTPENHEAQAYIMEELVRQVTRIYQDSGSGKSELDDL